MPYQMEPSQIDGTPEPRLPFWKSRPFWIISGAILLIILAAVGWLIFRHLNKKPAPVISTPVASTTAPAVLPSDITATSTTATAIADMSELEKYSFADFYKEPGTMPQFNFKNYGLPLNVKIDALNYYDVARKFNLDSGVSSLNANGFALLNNPDAAHLTDFYSAYAWLSNKQIPLLITDDFLLHYHQDVIKQAFKDIEENIFYDNLWQISQSLYQASRSRYEAHLAKIGNVNDQTLEGERLATAYFAVALKLMEPDASQVDTTGKDTTKFTSQEANHLYFNILPYLKSDAGAEVDLIKAANGVKKSPVLLYNRDYSAFVVPDEYRRDAKLYNFYLASTWLNSVFPLVTKDKNCPTCLLDKDDDRINLIAATFITKDFSANQQLKNRWALVYKLLSYSKGLRDDLTYRHYDEAMVALFGKDYDPEKVFAEGGAASAKNLEKLRRQLLALPFNGSLGALDKTKDKTRLGFKLLSDYYYPNSYIFGSLSGAAIGKYSGSKPSSMNNTLCKGGTDRCNGSGFDVVGLAADKVKTDPAWLENTSYANYDARLTAFKAALQPESLWHNSNFWSTVGAMKTLFANNNNQMQAYYNTDPWKNRLADSAAAAWVDLQLPLESLVLSGTTQTGLSSDLSSVDNSYVEPNYALIEKLIADNEMIYGMFNVMGVNTQVSSVALSLKDENNKLRQFSEIIKKELDGEALNSDNEIFISSVVGQYQVSKTPVSQLTLTSNGATIYENLGLKFMPLVYETAGGKYIAVGPVFSYQEQRLNR